MRVTPIDDVVARVANSHADRPRVVAIAGAVAVGKSTVARAIADALIRRGLRARVIGTDGFLFSNDTLASRGLTHRKGFPESFDLHALARFVGGVIAGTFPARAPVYSHEIYDIVPSVYDELDACDVLVLEGVVALHDEIAPLADVAVYVHAEEPVVREWFVSRFLDLVDAARREHASFYRAFVDMTPARVREIAEATWDGINAVNLRDHILPTRANATVVLTKNEDHSFT